MCVLSNWGSYVAWEETGTHSRPQPPHHAHPLCVFQCFLGMVVILTLEITAATVVLLVYVESHLSAIYSTLLNNREQNGMSEFI